MAETVEFASNGNTASGYLARPSSGSGPGVIVVQEWWGVDSGIKQSAERLADAGFVALVPDLYHGEVAGHDEMDKAAQLMQSLPPDRAARDMSGAVDFLAGHDAVTGEGVGGRRLLHGRDAQLDPRGEPPRQGEGRGGVLRLSAG